MAEGTSKKTKVTAKPVSKPAAAPKPRPAGKAAQPARKAVAGKSAGLAPLAHQRIVLLIDRNRLNADQSQALEVLLDGTDGNSYAASAVQVVDLIADFLSFVSSDSGPIFMGKTPRNYSRKTRGSAG